MVDDHYRYIRLGVEWFLCESKMANCKSVGPEKDAMIDGMQWLAG